MLKHRYLFYGILIILALVIALFLGAKYGSGLLFSKNSTSVSNTMKQVLGKDWSDYGKKDTRSDSNAFFFTFVSDGNINQKPLDIKTKNGKVLATAELSDIGSYYDKNGKKQHLIVPLLIRLADGKLFHPAFTKPIIWQGSDLTQKIVESANLFGSIKGQVMKVEIIPPNIPLGKSGIEGDIHDEVAPLIDQFNASWEHELLGLIKNGDPSVGIIFPYGFVNISPIQYVSDF
jgi:hypothetical protein